MSRLVFELKSHVEISFKAKNSRRDVVLRLILTSRLVFELISWVRLLVLRILGVSPVVPSCVPS